jgi:hypothetical protein
MMITTQQQSHDLVRDGALFRCQVCGMTWKSRSQTTCRGVPVYHVWKAIPAGLHTKTQLSRERLLIPEGVQPVALMIGEHDEYWLYCRESAIPMPPKVERTPRDYSTRFEKRYPDRRAAYADAGEALFHLNRYAKHETCSEKHQDAIYDLKNRLCHKLYQEGFCSEAIHIKSPPIEDECWNCDGTGLHWSGEACRKCGGTGVYRTKTRGYWAFRFLVDGREFAWHQPERLAPWAKPLGEQTQHEVEIEEKPVALKAAKFAEAKALIAWVLNGTQEPL